MIKDLSCRFHIARCLLHTLAKTNTRPSCHLNLSNFLKAFSVVHGNGIHTAKLRCVATSGDQFELCKIIQRIGQLFTTPTRSQQIYVRAARPSQKCPLLQNALQCSGGEQCKLQRSIMQHKMYRNAKCSVRAV